MARPTTNDDDVAARLVDAAYTLLADQGADGVTVRAVATRAGASTTAIYTLFGGKEGLVAAAVTRAAESLFRALADPPERAMAGSEDLAGLAPLYAMGMAYLTWAHRHPRLYAALFGGSVTFTPSADPASLGVADPARPLMEHVREAVHRGELTGPPELVAATLWSGLHGLAVLTGSGALDAATGAAVGPALARALLRGWAPSGAPPQAASAGEEAPARRLR